MLNLEPTLLVKLKIQISKLEHSNCAWIRNWLLSVCSHTSLFFNFFFLFLPADEFYIRVFLWMIWLSRSSGNPHCHSVDRVMKEKCGVLNRPFLIRTAVYYFHNYMHVLWNTFMGYDCKPIKHCLKINLGPNQTSQFLCKILVLQFLCNI